MSSPLSMCPSKAHSVGISRFFPQEETVNDNLSLSPAISQWLDAHSDIPQGKCGLGETQRALPYAKGQYPRFSALSPGRYLPSRARRPHPPGTRYQGNPVPVALQVPVRETEELVAAAGRDLAVISELDWLTSGASHLLGQMAATPPLLPFISSITLLQCYALETCRSVEMLELSSTARYANHIWQLRDGHLSKLHGSVLKQTRESLRQAALLGQHLFPEETVAIAGQNLRGDVQRMNLSHSLKFFSAAKQTASTKASSQSPRVKQNPPQQSPMAAGRGRGGKASRGKSTKTSRGRGRGIQNQKHSRPMGSKNPIGGVQPPFIQSSSSYFSHLSGALPESGEKEGSSPSCEGNGDEMGNRSHTDSFSGLLQSALSSAESRVGGGTWRPIIDLSTLNTHIQCPSFKMETQWVSSQSPAKREMAHRSGFERRLLSYPCQPLVQAVPSVL